MRIIRHGVKPEEEKLYFICYHCKCEFIAEKCECTFEDDGRNGGCFVIDCPDCGTSIVGTDKEKFMTEKRKSVKDW